MKPARLPHNEIERLKALSELKILDTDADDDYDNITELAGFICGAPVSLISFIDKERQWFKSKKGIGVNETRRDYSFCAHAILEPSKVFEVEDSRNDERFIDNPLTKLDEPVIFYAGIPIKAENGMPLGSLCVIDHKPNKLSMEQKRALVRLGKQVERLLLLRATNADLIKTKKNLKKHNGLLKEFAGVVSHDLKMPLANIVITSDVVKEKYNGVLDDRGIEYLDYLKKTSLSMSDYITKVLEHYECIAYDVDDTQYFDVKAFLEELIDLLNIKDTCQINAPKESLEIHCNKIALKQIFINLIVNSLKYNDKAETIIDIKVRQTEDLFEFIIRDNGRGIEKEKLDTIFELFTTVGHLDNEGNKGHGIGLSTVQKIVDSMGGTISVSSKLGAYSEFTFTIPDM